MGDRQIRVGDLVMVVKTAPCGCTNGLGFIFTVMGFDRSHRFNYCRWCGKTYGIHDQALGAGIRSAVYRLKRLDPDALNESIPTRQEIES